MALAVHPSVTYVKAEQQGKVYILAENLLDKVLIQDYEVIAKMQGSELEGVEYATADALPHARQEGILRHPG